MRKISVIIPCFNVEQYIGRCLDSLLAQTIGTEMFEVICLDDRSEDKTLNVLKDYAGRYPELIRVIELPENGRQGRARNIGLEEADCEWIAFVDSDDWTEPDYLEKMYSLTDKAGRSVDLVACDYERDFSKELTYFDRAGVSGGPGSSSVSSARLIRVTNKEERKDFVRARALSYSVYSKLIRRSFLRDNGIYFPEGLAYEDIYWGGMLNMYASDVILFDDKLYHYFVNESSTLLKPGAGYHTDMLTVQEMLWNDYITRGLMDDYHAEIGLEFVYSCALAFWKIIVLRFTEPPFNLYQLLCTYTRTHIPDIFENEYVKKGALSEMHTLMLKSLFEPLSKEQFESFAANIKTIGI